MHCVAASQWQLLLTARPQSLRIEQCLSLSRDSAHFMNSENYYHGHSRPPVVPVLSQMKPFRVIKSCFSKVHFNVILSFKPSSGKLSLSLRLLHRNPLRISLLPHTCMPSPSYLPLVDEDDLLRSTNHEPPDVEFSLSSCYFISGPISFLSIHFSQSACVLP